MQPHTKRTRTSAKQIDQIDPITSIQIEERRGLSFEGELIVMAVTVVLAEFGKSFVGQFAKTIVESIVKKVQRIRAGSSVEVVYQGSLTPRLKAELTIRYRSAKVLKKDKNKNPYYLAMAGAFLVDVF